MKEKYIRATRGAKLCNARLEDEINKMTERFAVDFGTPEITAAFITVKNPLCKPRFVPAFKVDTPSEEAVPIGRWSCYSVFTIQTGEGMVYELVEQKGGA